MHWKHYRETTEMLACSTYYTISYEHFWKLYSLIFIQMKINFIKMFRIMRKLLNLDKVKLAPVTSYYIDLSRMGSWTDMICSFVCTALTRHYFNFCYGNSLNPTFYITPLSLSKTRLYDMWQYNTIHVTLCSYGSTKLQKHMTYSLLQLHKVTKI